MKIIAKLVRYVTSILIRFLNLIESDVILNTHGWRLQERFRKHFGFALVALNTLTR